MAVRSSDFEVTRTRMLNRCIRRIHLRLSIVNGDTPPRQVHSPFFEGLGPIDVFGDSLDNLDEQFWRERALAVHEIERNLQVGREPTG